jgi:hypothetical protein
VTHTIPAFETNALEVPQIYVNKNLVSGFIRDSKFLASIPIFLVRRKGQVT